MPVFILVAIAIPSFKLLYNQYSFPPPDLTIKAIGHAWNWTHEFPDQGISVDSVMLQDNEREEAIKAGMPAEQVPRNLAVDNEMLVPVNKVVHVLVTSTDVIHNWTIPSFGSKVDAVPGRITATWFKATKEGIYFGQCSELCGKDHAFMPIAMRVVKEQVFNDWAAALKARDRKKAQRDHPQRRGRARGAAEGRRRGQARIGRACTAGRRACRCAATAQNELRR